MTPIRTGAIITARGETTNASHPAGTVRPPQRRAGAAEASRPPAPRPSRRHPDHPPPRRLRAWPVPSTTSRDQKL